MVITTQFDIGQTVWPIWSNTRRDTFPCETCKGAGSFEVVPGKHSPCPDASFSGAGPRCESGRKTRQWRESWEVQEPSEIGLIEVRITRDGPRPSDASTADGDEHRYMIQSTGVGSGTVWGASKLFATEGAAQAECDRRNAAAPRWTVDEYGRRTPVEAT